MAEAGMKQHIDVTDRGITLSKSLAWTIVTGLVVAAFALGSEMRHNSTTLDNLVRQQVEMTEEQAEFRREMDSRVRTLEQERASTAGQMVSLRRDLGEFREDMRDLRALLRVIEQRLNGNGSE